jgi:nucleoside-diphosphate-sugar epimerase|tara:strand:- start:220 stop:1044 length:825 start_codon:yes stop_codon:yes gene_type:complete
MYSCGITGHAGILGKSIQKKLGFRFIKFNGDITNIKDVEKWISKNNFDYMIHLAAIVPTANVEKNYLKSKKVNYVGTKNLINSLIKYKKKIKLFFFSSTSHVYRPKYQFIKLNENSLTKPYSKYGKTKLLAEQYIKKKLKKKVKFCIGRIFSFTHKNQDISFVVPSLFKKIKKLKGKSILLDNLNHYRDFISTEDICSAIELVLKKKVTGVLNIGVGKKIKLLEIASYFCKKFKVKLLNRVNQKPTFLISNNQKLKNEGWKPKNNFFYELRKFK